MSAEEQKTILLVDDEAIIAMAEKSALEKYGYNVITALSGEQAVTMVESTPDIDLILMDINLGKGMDGTEAATIILRRRDLPVVFLSSHMEPEVVAKTEKITFYGYVVKDSSITVLDASIKMAFKLFAAKIKEREKEAALKESEHKIRALFDETSQLIGMMTLDGTLIEGNRAAMQFAGINDSDCIGKPFWDTPWWTHSSEMQDKLREAVIKAARGETVRFEATHLAADGSIHYIDFSLKPIKDENDKVIFLMPEGIDITEGKQAAEVIFQSKKDWEDCFDSITDMITIHDNDFNIIRTNKAGKELLKLPALEEHLKFKCFSFYHGTDAPPEGCPSCDCLKSGIIGVFEVFEPHLDRYLEIRALPRFDSKKQSVGLIHIVRDITERKQAEAQMETALEALRESEERYQAFFNTSRDCAYITSADGKWLFMNESAVELFGYSSREELKDVNIPDLYVNPQERLECNKLTIEKNYNKDFPVALRRKDGAVIHALITEVPRYDSDGKLIGFQGTIRNTTERRHLETQRAADLKALRESEERYRSILHASPDGIAITDLEGRILMVSPAVLNIFAYKRQEELLGHSFSDFFVPEDHERAAANVALMFQGTMTGPGEYRGLRANGSTFDIEANGEFIRSAEGQPTQMVFIIRDISERKQAESQREAALKALSESEISFQKQRDAIAELTTNEAIAYGDVETAKTILMETAAAILHVARASIWLLADNGRQLRCIDLFEAPARKHSEGIILKAEDYPNYFKALKEDSQVAADDARNDPRTSEFTHGYLLPLGISSMLDSVLLSKEGVVGVICFEHVGEARQWQPHEASFSNTLASLFSRTLAIDEQKRTEKALQVSEERYRTLVENASDIVYSTDRAGHFTYVNRAALTTTGYEERELIGKLYPTLIHPDIRKRAIKLFLSQVKNGIQNTYSEFPILTKDGREIWFGQNTQLIKKDGRVTGLQAVSRDITEIKRVESQKQAALAALKESEERYRALVENASDLVFSTDKAGYFTFANLAARTVTGYEERELIGKMYTFLIRPDMRVRALRFYGRQLAKGINNSYFEFPIITKDGREVWLGQNVQLRKENGQVTGVQALTRDISERKQVEEALLASEAKQSDALQMTKSGHWEYDVDRDEFTFNDNFYRIFRTTAAAVGGYRMSSGEYARRFCHPDDMARVGSETRLAIETRDPDYSRQIEHRILYADGEIGWIAVRFFISKNSQGRTVKTYGVNQDISERKQAEEEIKRQLAEKETLLMEVHHRIKNNIASISGLLSLHIQSIANPQAIAVLKDAGSRVDSMRLLYDKLLLTENYEDLSVKNYLDDLIDTIIAIFPDHAKITIKKRIADFDLDSKRLFPLGIIINELLTNKMKYAFSDKDAGIIKISLSKADNRVALTIQDDGKRLPAGFDINKTKGFGLTLVKMLSQQLGGSFSMEKRKGTKCIIEFDI